MCSTPAFPNILGAKGVFEDPRISLSRIKKVSNGTVLSVKKVYKDPVNIFSKPRAKTQSFCPNLTEFAAR
jgi:hypothetical protein